MPARVPRKMLGDLWVVLFLGLLTLVMAGMAVHNAMKWLTTDEPKGRYECIGPNGAIMSCVSGDAANRNAAAIYGLTSIIPLVGVVCCIRGLRTEMQSAEGDRRES